MLLTIQKAINWQIRKLRIKQITRVVSLRTNIQAFTQREGENIAWGTEEEMANDGRQMVEPVKLLHHLETRVKIPLSDLKRMEKELKERITMLEDDLDIDAETTYRALDMVRARKKYNKVAHLFDWKTTTKDKIQKLIKIYMLEHNSIDLYDKRIPDEALKEISAFKKLYKKVAKLKPAFSIIAPAGDFKKRTADPILLAKSPFGEYYFILCAWDKEVSLVKDLLENEDLNVEGL